ncbi:MAG: metalloregulator ArsR/SmtB family transcription factor [Nitrososphaeria archaeon]
MCFLKNPMSSLDRTRAKVFRALGDVLRLKILALLRNGELCVCEIISRLNVPQPLVSRHLKILKECGIVKVRREMNRRYYSVTDKRIFDVIEVVSPDFLESIRKHTMEF